MLPNFGKYSYSEILAYSGNYGNVVILPNFNNMVILPNFNNMVILLIFSIPYSIVILPNLVMRSF